MRPRSTSPSASGPRKRCGKASITSGALCETSPLGVGVSSAEGKIIYTNRAYEEILGYEPGGLLGQPSTIVYYDPIDRQAWLATMKEKGKITDYEVRFRHKDGNTIWISINVAPIEFRGGPAIIGVIQDVSERKQMEEALRESEERFRTVQDNSLDRFSILKPIFNDSGDITDFTYVYHNAQASRIVGRRPDEMLGKRVSEIFPTFSKTRFFTIYKQVIETGQAQEIEDRYNFDGVDEWFRATLTPVSDGIAIAAQSITEQKKAEEELQFRANILASVRDTMWVADGDFNITYWNETATAMFGWKAEEVLGRNTGELFKTKVIGSTRDAAITHLQKTDGFFGEVALQRKDGGSISVEVSSRIVCGSGGKILRVVTTVRDITERKRAEEALHEADRQKNRFLATLSHELRNPLAAIGNALYILEHRDADFDQAGKAREIIRRQFGHMTRMVDDLLDVTRITRDKITLQKHWLELNALVRRTIEDHRSLFEDSGILLETYFSPNPIHVVADEIRMAQVVWNLLHNAIKFTDSGGRIRVSVEMDPLQGMAVVQVSDNGAGIAPEVMPQIFAPFVQADVTLDRSRGGLGLGLALVKGLVELHGGEISAKSDGIGKGSEFTVKIPLDYSVTEEADMGGGGFSGPKRSVLIIEDNTDLAESLRVLLEMEGHEVDLAHTGVEGLARIRQSHPEIVFCDIGLPGMDGYSVAKAIRANRELQGIYLVALTGYASPEDLPLAKEAGFDRHLAKPLELDVLTKMLKEM